MDKRKLNGGKREGAGRKPKDEELKLVEKLTPLEPLAFEALKKGLEKGDFKYVQLYYNYVAGNQKKQRTYTSTKMYLYLLINATNQNLST